MGNIILLTGIVMALSVGAHVIVKSKTCLHANKFIIDNDTIKNA